MLTKLSGVKKLLISIPFIILLISSIFGFYFLSYSTSKVETIYFPSVLPDLAPNDVTITSGRIFYPSNYVNGRQYPVVIYVHGFQVTKETDLRLILELTKRGIFALAVDLPGHGQTKSILGPYFWKVVIGAIDYIYKRPDIFNLSAVGVCGHSMGGWASFLAMGYEAKRQNRINVSVSWAGIFNTTSFREDVLTSGSFDNDLRNIKVDNSLFYNSKYLYDHNPANYYTNNSLGAQPAPDKFGPRILVIQGNKDSIVDPSQALEANNTLGKNCSLYMINGEDHLLLTNHAIIRTIQYFELHYFGVQESEAEISSNLTYLNVYLSYFFSLIGLFFSILSCVFLVWYYFQGNTEIPQKFKPKGWKFTIITILPYFGVLAIFWVLQSILFNVLLSLLISSIILGLYSLILYYFANYEYISNSGFVKKATKEHNLFALFAGFHLGLLATFGYWALSNYYSMLVFMPWNIDYFIYAFLYLIPIVFFNEFFWRKIIQDNVPIKNRWFKRLFMVIPIFFCGILFIELMNTSFLSIMAFAITFLATSLTNIFIYSKYKSIRATIIFALIPLAFIAGNCYFFFI